jgi:hypothetical protein
MDLIAELDCLIAFTLAARQLNYVRPVLVDENIVEIVEGRHPLGEVCIEMFVPNDTDLGVSGKSTIQIITGVPCAVARSPSHRLDIRFHWIPGKLLQTVVPLALSGGCAASTCAQSQLLRRAKLLWQKCIPQAGGSPPTLTESVYRLDRIGFIASCYGWFSLQTALIVFLAVRLSSES